MNLLKRTISIVSAIAISASIGISVMAAGFTDVSEQSPYYDAISYTSEAGIFSGISDTEFAPDVQLTRGMYVTLLGKVYLTLKQYQEAVESGCRNRISRCITGRLLWSICMLGMEKRNSFGL